MGKRYWLRLAPENDKKATVLDARSIDNQEQDRPSLVVDDLRMFVRPEIIYASLLRRGVFKWLAVRRDLIRIKYTWKARIRASLSRQAASRDSVARAEERGYRRALEQCRAEVRAMCHSPRWRAPDFDKRAVHFLRNAS